MESFDWIVVGGGITGAALGYELVDRGCKVLLLERDAVLRGATRYSYGGIAHWAGNTELTRTICAESLAIHRFLSRELDAPTQFREIDMLLTVGHEDDRDAVIESFAQFTRQPDQLTPQEAKALEPQLNPAALSLALRLPHAHIEAQATTMAYRSAIKRRNGKVCVAEVTAVHNDRVETTAGEFAAANIVLCAGSETRKLVHELGLEVPVYFSYAESVETVPVQARLRTIVMPAITQRFELEADASRVEVASAWNQPNREIAAPIMDAGALQFENGHIRMGQITRTLSNPNASLNPLKSEDWIRRSIREILPEIAGLAGAWCCCTVAFSRDHLPLIGPLPNQPNVHLFSGFSNPMALVPGLARRFAKSATGEADALLAPLSPMRFLPDA
ncbi:FAD-binding oxidoreductase [filamentous cyanobacterium LEGE 11480]|uniref:FAD-binding oxidoreductase n=1 Tax=Romeriopsis navalis LEGE 11480 TaxID=2777977 RepID=A0A928Z2M3_9CYAN|nr:FAD-binding oxidoreductase [Romeriopsis navalis]MBE9028278.1 FAD-binding oxidoreductase [Romeriopsis navalis LEGE 11480]